MTHDRPVVFDDDNPEWTKEDFARARPAGEVFGEAEMRAFEAPRRVGRPIGSATSKKSLVSLRLDNDVIDKFRATGPGWQSRINDALKRAKA